MHHTAFECRSTRLWSGQLFCTEAASVVPHFESLRSKGVQQLTYSNHEGVPESEEITDYFTAVTLFRRHHMTVGAAALSRPFRS